MKLSSILEDNSGGFSSSRFQMLAWGLGVLLVWGFVAVKTALDPIPIALIPDKDNPAITYVEKAKPTLPSIPNEVIAVLLGFTGWKTAQRFAEKAENKDEKV